MKPARLLTTLATAALFATAATALHGCTTGKTQPRVGLPPVPTGQIAQGQHVFDQHCNQCHPGGRAGVGPALRNKDLPPALIKTQVRTGGGKMPAFSEHHISDKELNALIAYVEWLQRQTP